MKLITVLGILCYSIHIQAQGVPEIPSQVPFSVSSNAVKTFDQRYEKIKGTPTLFEKYNDGKIFFTQEQERVMLMNYDAFNDQVLIKRDTGAVPFAIRKDVIEKFIITQEGHTYEFERITFNQKDGYFLKLSTGKKTLYCKVSKVIHRSKAAGDHYSEAAPDEFLVLNQYYLKQENGTLQELQKSRKSIENAFPDNKAEVASILKKHKVNFNDYWKMALIFDAIDKL
ncbi:MAG: hypothetical protein KF856_06970 [Cyclobacteriaceae bacterium]|nr:hypothetical protein [Cyclobacteriaceae bacterium]